MNNQEFKLVNKQTKTWMDYYKDATGQDEEEIRFDYDEINFEGISTYSADVMLNGKKLFSVDCLLFTGIGEWVEYHISQDSITDLGRQLLDKIGPLAFEDEEEIILDITDVRFDDESTVEKMLQPVIDKLGGAELKEAVEGADADEIYVYQFPNSIENFLPEFERLCDESGLDFLGKGHGFDHKEGDEPDFFVEGPLKDLEAIADELEYELHPDYLAKADEFDYDIILKKEKKSVIKEAVESNFTEEEANKFVKELTQKFFDEGEFFDIWSEKGVIKADIQWGDWKHQHLFFKARVQKYFDALGIDIDIKSTVTEEDGTDAYSASYSIKKQ